MRSTPAVEAQIADAADASLLASDLRSALDRLTGSLLLCRRLYPDFRDKVRGWFDGDGDLLASLRRLVARGRVVALGDAAAGDPSQLPWHDRVRDHLLTGAMARLIAGGRLPPELWADPFYAELIGGALPQVPQAAVAEAVAAQPARDLCCAPVPRSGRGAPAMPWSRPRRNGSAPGILRATSSVTISAITRCAISRARTRRS